MDKTLGDAISKDPTKGYAGAGHFASKLEYEVQRTNHFEVVLNLPQDLLSGNAQEHLRLSTKSISAPKIAAEQIMLKHGNETIKVAAAPTYDDLNLTVYDTLGVDQIALLQSWFGKVFDPETKLMGNVRDYKCTGTLYMYSPDAKVMRTWSLFGVWPRSFAASNDFSFDGASEQNITVELSVDRYVETTARSDFGAE